MFGTVFSLFGEEISVVLHFAVFPFKRCPLSAKIHFVPVLFAKRNPQLNTPFLLNRIAMLPAGVILVFVLIGLVGK
jgi:hypothetical protein